MGMSFRIDDSPVLRWPLDIQHLESQGQKLVVLRDNQGVAQEPLVMPAALLAIVARFDGTRTLRSILEEGAEFGLTEELLFTIVSDLESLGYLETEQTKQRWQEIKQEYTQSDLRPAAHAGSVYPADPKELERCLASYLSQGGIKKSQAAGTKQTAAILSPHIDYTRGWRAYVEAFGALQDALVPDVIILIGTSHQSSQGIFHLARKDFSSPLGRVPLAREVVENLGKRYGVERSFGEEILHRTEHSLELQIPFIQHCYRGAVVPEIVPILVGSFHQYFFQDREPIEDAVVSDFVDALSEEVAALEVSGKRVLFFAGVDFAHVGTHFGDNAPCDLKRQQEVKQQDHLLLQAALRVDPTGVYTHMALDQDARRVCGYPSMYTMFSVMRSVGWQLSGKTLGYHQAVDSQSDCVVSFASASWQHA